MSLSAGIGNDGAPQAPVQLVVYGFAPGARFEGQLVGALERLESGGALRIVEVLFVQRDEASGELVAIDAKGGSAGGMVSRLLDFRLGSSGRNRATARALGDPDGDAEQSPLRALGAGLEPGAGLAAVLVEHLWAGTLEDAAMRTGGSRLADEFVTGRGFAELAPELLAAAARRQRV
jgi:hypothetical protein